MNEQGEGGAAPRLSRRVQAVLLVAVAAVAAITVVAIVRPGGTRAAARETEEAPATLTVPSAELRTSPRENADRRERLRHGARLRVVTDRGRWVEVRTDSGASGYLRAETLERDSERDARKKRGRTILGYPPVFGLVGEDCDVVLAPFPLAPRAGRLSRGETIRVHSIDHAYYAFEFAPGELAFVDSSCVDLVPPDPRKPAIVPPADVRPLKNLTVSTEPLPEEEGLGVEEGGDSLEEPLPPLDVDENPVEPATLLSRVDPVYPEPARRAGVSGTVVLEAIIGPDGRVRHVRVLQGLSHGLSEAAAEAVRRWQYRPARGGEGPVASRKQVRIEFRLRS